MKYILLTSLLLSTQSWAIDIEQCYNENSQTIEIIQDEILDQSEDGRLTSDEYEKMMQEIEVATTCEEAQNIAIAYLKE